MTAPPSPRKARSGPLADRLFALMAKGAALLTLSLLMAIMVTLFIGAWPAIKEFGPGFLTSAV